MLPRRQARYVNKNHDLLKGAVGWWKALPHNAGGAYLVNVLSPGQLLGTRNGAVAWSGGQNGPCLNYTSTTGYASIANASALKPLTFSVSMWLKWTVAANRVIFETDGNNGYSVQNGLVTGTDGQIGMQVGAGKVVSAGTSYNDGIWHHVVLTYVQTGLVAKVYVDGNNDTLSNAVNNPAYSTGAILIGGRAGSFGFTGLLDDVVFWSRALSGAEVYDIYRESRAGFPNLLPRRRGSLLVPAAGGTTSHLLGLLGVGA